MQTLSLWALLSVHFRWIGTRQGFVCYYRQFFPLQLTLKKRMIKGTSIDLLSIKRKSTCKSDVQRFIQFGPEPRFAHTAISLSSVQFEINMQYEITDEYCGNCIKKTVWFDLMKSDTVHSEVQFSFMKKCKALDSFLKTYANSKHN